jgi:hypothetical protein
MNSEADDPDFQKKLTALLASIQRTVAEIKAAKKGERTTLCLKPQKPIVDEWDEEDD